MSTYIFGNGPDNNSFNNVGDGQSVWQFNGVENNASALPRSQGTFGMLGVQNTDIVVNTVAGAPEALLERNAFYIGIKKLASDRAMEIDTLKDTIRHMGQEIERRDKELDVMKIRCETMEGTIDRFSSDYHTLKDASGTRGQMIVLTGDIKQMPTPYKRDDIPNIKIWVKSQYSRSPTCIDNGESNGDPGAPSAKPKVGRPSKNEPSSGRANIYLQNLDGTMVNADQLHKLSVKARSVWEALLDKKMAPATFAKMSSAAWDFYARSVLNEPGLEFLLYCDDAQWKLREWSTQNYSSWTGNRGLRPKNCKNAKKNLADDILNDPVLIQMEKIDGKKELTSEAGDASNLDLGDDLDESPGPSAQTCLSTSGARSVIDDPFAPRAPGPASTSNIISTTGSSTLLNITNNSPLNIPSGSFAANTCTVANQATIGPNEDTAMANTRTSATDNTPTAATNNTPAATDMTGAAPHDTGPSCPDGSSNTAATTSATTIPSRPRIKLTMKPPVILTATEEGSSECSGPITVSSTLKQTAGPPESQNTDSDNPDPLTTSAPPTNIRLERARPTTANKRKGGGNVTSAAKKPKVATALAEPTKTTTIKNICMHRWNEQQPGGQGLATDFDAFFQTLSDSDKELLKKEMHTAQTAARKAKAAIKKTSGVPSVN